MLGMLTTLLDVLVPFLCGVCKLPQLSQQARRRSSAGLSKSSLALETAALSATACYFCANLYPVTSYLEYPLLVAQNLLLFAMAAHFESAAPGKVALATFGYAVPVYLLAARVVPMAVVQTVSVSIVDTLCDFPSD